MPINLISNTIDDRDMLDVINYMSQNPQPRLSKSVKTVEFEEKWSTYLGSNYSVYVNSGSNAILLTLYALLQNGKINKNDKIIVPSLSWITDVSSPMQLGLQPILCDCNMEDLSVDLTHLEKLFKEEKPSALILVHVLGLVPDMDSIIKLCTDYNVSLIEDCCEVCGSEYNGKKLGTFGIASCHSQYISHFFSTIEGGLISTNDKDFHELLISLRSHGWSRDLSKSTKDKLNEQWNVKEFQDLYTFYYPGFNFRATEIQAVIGLSQIDKLDEFKRIRNKNFLLYNKRIKNNQLNLRISATDFIGNFAYPFVHKRIEEIIKELQQNEIEIRPIIAGSMGRKPFWIKEYGECELINADIIDKYGIYLPNHSELSASDIFEITEILNKY